MQLRHDMHVRLRVVHNSRTFFSVGCRCSANQPVSISFRFANVSARDVSRRAVTAAAPAAFMFRKTLRCVDETATVSALILASRLHLLMTTASQSWFKLRLSIRGRLRLSNTFNGDTNRWVRGWTIPRHACGRGGRQVKRVEAWTRFSNASKSL